MNVEMDDLLKLVGELTIQNRVLMSELAMLRKQCSHCECHDDCGDHTEKAE